MFQNDLGRSSVQFSPGSNDWQSIASFFTILAVTTALLGIPTRDAPVAHCAFCILVMVLVDQCIFNVTNLYVCVRNRGVCICVRNRGIFFLLSVLGSATLLQMLGLRNTAKAQ